MTSRALVPCLLALLAAPLAAAPAASIQTQKLANGLTLVLAPDPAAGAVDVTVWYRAGTRREAAGKTGLTHLIEQLMFRGTGPAGDDYIQRIRAMGGTLGTESTPDYSSFYQTVPPEGLAEIFEMEAARMQSLPGSAADFAEVAERVRQNRARTENSPIVRGMQRMFAGAFEGHPYAWPATGLETDLAAVTLEDCVAFHRAHYGPAQAVVTVTGRFDPADAAAAAKRTLGRVPRRPAPKGADAALPAAAARRIVGNYAFAGPSVLLAWRVPAANADDAAALDLLARCLGGSGRGPLDRSLLGEGRPAAYVQSGVELRRDAGLFYALAALRAGADTAAVRTAERTVLDEIARVAREGLTAEAVDQARRSVRVARLFGMQRPRDRAAAIGKGGMLADDFESARKADARLAALTPADLQAAARRWLAGGSPVTVWMLPEGGAEGGAR